ncbi:hypothetical protein [Streptomyces fodineus]|uniref:hypothetical protein n=1 Tax=Streptomyces fodineus TaxID=1904616 RepID=UPI000A72C704|nr:hypothetical protein [Streptomyces fodineus]
MRDVLDNRHVAGIRVFRSEEVRDGEWPAIIDRGTWLEVRERRAYRLDTPRCNRAVSAPILEEFVSEATINLLERLDLSEAPTPPELSEEDRTAIEADRRALDELKDMWQKQELKTREYREIRKTVEARIAEIERKMIVRPTTEALDGLVGPHARVNWEALKEAEEYERMNAVILPGQGRGGLITRSPLMSRDPVTDAYLAGA